VGKRLSECLISVLFFVLASWAVACGATPKLNVLDRSWLGPMDWDGEIHHWFSTPKDFNIHSMIIAGKDIIMEDTRNPVVLIRDGVPGPFARVMSDRQYLLTRIASGVRRQRLFRCVIRITDGALAGAIVRVKPDGWLDFKQDPYYSLVEVPRVERLSEGDLNILVVDFMAK
jgi:hypothetical protein